MRCPYAGPVRSRRETPDAQSLGLPDPSHCPPALIPQALEAHQAFLSGHPGHLRTLEAITALGWRVVRERPDLPLSQRQSALRLVFESVRRRADRQPRRLAVWMELLELMEGAERAHADPGSEFAHITSMPPDDLTDFREEHLRALDHVLRLLDVGGAPEERLRLRWRRAVTQGQLGDHEGARVALEALLADLPAGDERRTALHAELQGLGPQPPSSGR